MTPARRTWADRVARPLPKMAVEFWCLLGNDLIESGQYVHLAMVDGAQGAICEDHYLEWEAEQPIKLGWVQI